MVFGADFLYFLHDENLNFYYLDSYGKVYPTTTPKPLQYSPDGWQEISIQSKRSANYFGLERSFTIPLNFVEDGATIIKNAFYRNGVEAKLFLLIVEKKLQYTPPTFGFIHKYLHKGECDLSTFDHLGPKVTCNLIEGGLAKLIKAHENTVYEIPMDVSDAVNVKMDGIVLKASSNYITIDETQSAALSAYNVAWLQTVHTGNDGTIFDTVQNSTTPLTAVGSNTPYNDSGNADNYFFKADAPVTVRFSSTFKPVLSNGISAELYIKRSTGGRISLFTLNGTLGSSPLTVTGTYNVDVSITLAAGERLYLTSQLIDNPNISGGAAVFYPGTEISVKYDSRYKTTHIKALRALYVLQQLISKMSDGKYTASSTLLQTFSDHVLTCGDAIRGLSGSKMKTSLNQFWEWCNATFCAGLAVIKDTLVIEAKEYFIDGLLPTTTPVSGSGVDQDVMVIDLGRVSKLNPKPATDMLFSSVKIGYANQTYDNLNGKDEFNNTHSYTTAITRVSKELTLISPYRADMHGIEQLRINLAGKKTTDSSADNQTFVILINNNVKVNSNGNPDDDYFYYELDRSLNGGASGLIDAPSAFNLGLNPKIMLYCHGWYIRSVLHQLENTDLKFQTTEKNSTAIIGGLKMNDSIPVAAFASPKFQPVEFEFEAQMPDNYMELLNETAIRKYLIAYEHATLIGIALQTGYEPSTRKAMTVRLLSDASNDLTQLIDING